MRFLIFISFFMNECREEIDIESGEVTIYWHRLDQDGQYSSGKIEYRAEHW